MKIRKYAELNALKGRIREKKSSYQSLSEKMGVSKNALNDKINGYSVFNIDEVGFLVEELDIPDREIIRYFFPHMLRNVTSKRAVGE
jgi:transcriptional regulator with XRE-family HTH domain